MLDLGEGTLFVMAQNAASGSEHDPLYLNPDLPISERVDDLVSRMTLTEKVSQMLHGAPAIERLGIPEYNWWNECLHGVARAGLSTVFPQGIGLGSMWNTDLLRRAGNAISDEARAKHHDFARQGIYDWYTGLTFWTPNINIFRDPRWGRGQETFGEDPYLTARYGVIYVQALQGDDPRYLKLVATPKHYAVHSGPEADRHHFDAQATERDLWDTYLPHFEAAIREGRAVSIMGAYNRFRGEPACASDLLLGEILRGQWGFDGYVVSDCGAIEDIYEHHKVTETAEEGAALAVKAGCDLCCGCAYEALVAAVEQGLLDEADIDRSVKRLFTARFQLGMFDPPERVPYAQIPYSVVDCAEHRALALETARESMVLLKNDGVLPLARDLRSIAVIGPNADDAQVLLGNYHGTPSASVTPLEGIRRKVGEGVEVTYAPGCDIRRPARDGFDAAVKIAQDADLAVMVLGLSQRIEGEEGQEEGVGAGEISTGDRTSIELPEVQQALLEAVHATGTPVVLVLLNGSALAISWAAAHVPAILEAWYSGEEGGTAIADVLFGDYNPAGRLPVTFYAATADLPPFDDYTMQGRTYRYFEGAPLFPFGHGLSYTRFEYCDLRVEPSMMAALEPVTVSVTVKNLGERAGDEVVQLYVRDVETSVLAPRHHLEGFTRVHFEPGEEKVIVFTLEPRQLSLVREDGSRAIEPGAFEIAVGGGQPGYAASGCVTGTLTVMGEAVEL